MVVKVFNENVMLLLLLFFELRKKLKFDFVENWCILNFVIFLKKFVSFLFN